MELNKYQTLSQDTKVYPNQNTINGLVYSTLALCGETGELANKLKKHLRAETTPDVLVLADELGDVLWYVSSVADELGMTLEQIAQMNLDKLQIRKAKYKLSG